MRFLFIVLTLVTLISCRKGELPVSKYYGKVGVTVADLPNSPSIDVYFEGHRLGETNGAGVITSFVLESGKPGKLALFKHATDTLIADTIITVPVNKQIDFKVAFSEDLGIKGFLASQPVAADSIAFQFIYDLGDTDYPSTSVNLYLVRINFETGEYDPVDSLMNMQKGRLYPKILNLPFADADGNQYFYLTALKDAVTGEELVPPSGSPYFVTTADTPGTYYILRIYNQGGEIGVTFTAI
ncbi:hypothetical protein SAMN05428988_5736 [Chitinophaga sp. YR573]|uniref:hypothetical protein n=1 Tax=Chitinophaga sp. YR573 TaxID=1881040 RepID=UPI0008AD88AD|nr:hypothetical protein [Chitinophaga sp. YR573]SEW44298.1 hypothetical protein SAMN05428988_5736 [Chitinophaga sp. YR573]